MKKIVVMIVFSLSLFLVPTAVSGNYIPETEHMEVTGVVESEEYVEDVTITFTEESATLNGVPFVSGTVVNEVGIYTLVLFEAGIEVDSIEFTILPRFTNDITDMSVFDSIEIELENQGILTVANEVVTESITLDLVGEYIVTVEGVGGYSISYTVEVQNQLIEYIKAYEMYQDFTIDISVFKEVYYENELQTEDITFDEIGDYQLRVLNGDDTEEIIDFTYGYTTNRIEHGGIYTTSILIEKGTAQKWFINNIEQKQGIDSLYITTIGKHVVKYVGDNNYLKYYTITITEGDIGIEDGDVYEDFFQYKFSGFKITLNEVNYTSNSKKSGAGYYTLKVKGVNGYVNSYSIFINEEVPFEKQSITDEPQLIEESITLDQDFRKIYVNGKEEENFRFSESGEYRIVYQGVGGYIDAYTVYYENHHESVNETLFQGVIGIAGLVAITYIFVAWRRFK